jgi:hypothetical protein
VFNKLYLVFGTAMLGFYGLAGVMGWEFGHEKPGEIPADVRRAPGGYRSYFFSSAYRGGK